VNAGAADRPRPRGWAARPACCLAVLGLLASASLGCGGGAPLFHPAHVLHPGDVSAGAGVTGRLAFGSLDAAPPASAEANATLEALTVAPAVAPWIAARIGLPGENEAGLTYTSRTLRLDARHAFPVGSLTLSVGLGASAIVALRADQNATGAHVFGGGLDVPVLLGYRSTSDLYAAWIGPRLGAELLTGQVDPLVPSPGLADLRGHQLHAGAVAGVRVGFRHVHAAMELSVDYHRAAGRIGATDVQVGLLAITPGAGMVLSF